MILEKSRNAPIVGREQLMAAHTQYRDRWYDANTVAIGFKCVVRSIRDYPRDRPDDSTIGQHLISSSFKIAPTRCFPLDKGLSVQSIPAPNGRFWRIFELPRGQRSLCAHTRGSDFFWKFAKAINGGACFARLFYAQKLFNKCL